MQCEAFISLVCKDAAKQAPTTSVLGLIAFVREHFGFMHHVAQVLRLRPNPQEVAVLFWGVRLVYQ